MFCTNCGSSIPEDAEFCVNCGQAVQKGENANAAPVTATPVQPPPQAQEKNVFCTNCGEKIEEDSLFCPKCGVKAGTVFPEQHVISQTNGIFKTKKGRIAIWAAAGVVLVIIIANIFSNLSVFAQTVQTRLDNGKRLFDQSNYDGAIQELNEAIRLSPKKAEAYAYRSRAYSNGINDYDQALSDANTAIQLNPHLAMGHFARGRAYIGKNDTDRAITDYTEAIKLDPQYAQTYNNRGNAYKAKGDYDRAITDYNEAIRLDPKFAMAYYNRGIVYKNKGDIDRAIADYTEAIRLDPKYATAYNNRGDMYSRQYLARENINDNNYNLAQADFQAALKIDPNSQRAKDGLEQLNKNKTWIADKSRRDAAVASSGSSGANYDPFGRNSNNPMLDALRRASPDGYISDTERAYARMFEGINLGNPTAPRVSGYRVRGFCDVTRNGQVQRYNFSEDVQATSEGDARQQVTSRIYSQYPTANNLNVTQIIKF